MICKRCQRSLRTGEGVKCGICDSCFHMRYINDAVKDHRDGGDKGYQWKCSLCQNYVSNMNASGYKDKDNIGLMQAVNAISEKFELVNKIQLPKLNSDLAQIKTVAERIVQQNDSILRKFDEIEEKRKNEKPSYCSSSRYRRRNLNLAPKLNNGFENKEDAKVVPSLTEKNARYRTRRRSYLLHSIFNILNRKMNRTVRYS